MKYLLFSIFFFALPHAAWLPRQLNISASDVPLGVTNLILLLGLLLWVIGTDIKRSSKNPFSAFNYFIVVVIAGLGLAILSGYGDDFWEVLTLSKRRITLLLVYFIPLAIIRNEDDLIKYFAICLTVHLIIGLEILHSGILAGIHFNDNKRGSGPFALTWRGSDIAGSYLAQIIMFFWAVVFTGKMKKWLRFFALIVSLIMITGLFATYARGAMLSIFIGLIFILIIKGLKTRYLLLTLLVITVVFFSLPQSIKTRFLQTTSDSGELDESSQNRLALYSAGFEIVKQHPFGVGTGEIMNAMHQYYGSYVDCHNGFLETAAEYGIIGLSVFLWMLWVFFKASKDIYKRSNVPVAFKAYALGTGGMIGSFIGCNMFYANFYKELVMGTIIIHFGILASIKRQIDDKELGKSFFTEEDKPRKEEL